MQKRKEEWKKTWRGGWLLLLCILTVVLVPNTAAQAKSKNQGKAGRYSTWSYQPKSRTLTISGKGSVSTDDLLQWNEDDDEAVWLGKEDGNLPMFRKIIFQEGITEIDFQFFCLENITTISLPGSLKKIGYDFSELGLDEINGAFDPWSTTLRKIKVSKKNKKFKISGKALVSKDGKTFYAYPTGRSAKKYRIPGKVTKIGKYAFWGADIQKVVMGDRVSTIGTYAFKNSTVREVDFGKKLTKIGYGAFDTCQLSQIKLPSSLVTISDEAFYACPITELVIPAKVTKIGYLAFAHNKKLQKIVIRGNAMIEEEAFEETSYYKDKQKNIIQQPITVVLGKKMKASLETLCESLGDRIQFEVEQGNPKYYVKEGALYTLRGDILVYQPKKEEVTPSPAPAATTGTAQ